MKTDDYQLQFDDNLPSPAVDGGVQKKRLRSWLLDKLDSNDCPGCTWLDKDQRIFKLTWKHYGRPGFDEERVCVYVYYVASCCICKCGKNFIQKMFCVES